MATITSREFNHDVGSAKRAAKSEPVIVTDRGEPAYVLMTIGEYRKLRGPQQSLVDLLRAPSDDVEFEPGRFTLSPQVPEL